LKTFLCPLGQQSDASRASK